MLSFHDHPFAASVAKLAGPPGHAVLAVLKQHYGVHDFHHEHSSGRPLF